MRSSLLAMCMGLFFVSLVQAEELVVDQNELEFCDQTYVCRFVAGDENGRIAEYTLPDESIDNWQKLVAVRHYPQATATPREAAQIIIRGLQESNPQAKHQLLVKETGDEALLDFLIWPPDGSYIEFNVFRYVKFADQPGLVSYQFAFRFSGKEEDVTEKFKQARQIWLEAMRAADWQVAFSAAEVDETTEDEAAEEMSDEEESDEEAEEEDTEEEVDSYEEDEETEEEEASDE